MRARFDKIIAERKRNEDASSIKYWKSTGVASKGGVISDAEIQVWIDWLEKDGLFKPGQVKASDTTTFVPARRRRPDDLGQNPYRASP
ncbi:hypothetical protein [Bradyrhizobium canariense]|uniref:hypothetical protein n=1 Tax=Bradyrhizobium canariense TaxID=255045 RepID=UPI001FCD7958|nr:hypothetical protein [Bradyrhizobium canariense]